MGIGAVLGILFVKVQHRLPGRTIIRKSLVFAFGLYLISVISLLNFVFSYKPFLQSLWEITVISSAFYLIVDLLLGLLFGYLLANQKHRVIFSPGNDT